MRAFRVASAALALFALTPAVALPPGVNLILTSKRPSAVAVSYDSDATAFFARMSPAPSVACKTVYNTFFTALKADSTYSKLDAIYILKTAQSQWALLSLKSSTFDASVVSSPTFTANVGYSTNGTSNYVTTNFNPTTASSPHYVQNDAMFAVTLNTNQQHSASIAGFFDGTNGTTLNPRNTSDAYSYRVNQAATRTTSASSSTDSAATFILQRTASNAIALYRNTTSVDTGTTASATLANGALRLGSINDTTFAAQSWAAAAIGQSLTSGERTTLVNALTTILAAMPC